MALEYNKVKAPRGFDERNDAHVNAVVASLEKQGFGTGWRVLAYQADEQMIYISRGTAMTSVAAESGDEKQVSLGGRFKPTEGEKARQQLESAPQFEGYSLVEFNAHLDKATLAKLTDSEHRVRAAIATTIGSKPWEVRVHALADGGFRATLPQERYVPSKHDDKLTEVAQQVAGHEGWYLRTDPKASTVQLLPSDPPMFADLIPYPFGAVTGDPSDPDWVMKVPVGERLGAAGDSNDVLFLDLADVPGMLVTGTAGGGKAQPLTEVVRVPPSPTFPDGRAPIGRLRVGDEVIVADGGTGRVVDVSPVTLQRTYELTLETGQRFRATGNHLFRVGSGYLGTVPVAADHALASRLTRLARSEPAAASVAASTFLDSFGLDGDDVAHVLERMLGAVAFDDGRGGELLYPADESLIAVADWLRAGRTVPWVLRTTEQLLDDDGLRLLPVFEPEMYDIAEHGVTAVLRHARALVAGSEVPAWIQHGADQYERQAFAEAVRRVVDEAGGIDGELWTVDEAASSPVADVLRGVGYLVAERDGGLEVRSVSWVQIASIVDVGMEHSRCIVLDDPRHLYLTASWIVTHNSVSINSIIYGLLERGWEVAIGDVEHKALDFEWVKPWVREHGFGCSGVASTAAMLAHVYEEKDARSALLAQHGVQKWQDLPARVRPAPICVILDEVQGLVALDEVPKGMPKDHPYVVEAQQHNFEVAVLKRFMKKLPAELRFVGVRLLVCTQQAQANTGIDPSLKMNLVNRFLLGRNPNEQVRGHALQNPRAVPQVPAHIAAAKEGGRGVGVFEFEGQEPGVFKSFFASTDTYRVQIERIGAARAAHPDVSSALIDRYVGSLVEDAEDDHGGFGRGPRTYEPWQLGPDGQPLTGFELANAARHAATQGAKEE